MKNGLKAAATTKQNNIALLYNGEKGFELRYVMGEENGRWDGRLHK